MKKILELIFVKCAENGHMEKSYETWSPINKGTLLPWHKRL